MPRGLHASVPAIALAAALVWSRPAATAQIDKAIAVPVETISGDTISMLPVDRSLIAKIPTLRPLPLPAGVEPAPITTRIPAGARSMQVSLDNAGARQDLSPSIDILETIRTTSIVTGATLVEFGARPIFTTRLQMVTGPFDGDLGTTFIELDDWQAPVIAETPRAAWFVLPEGIPGGRHMLHIHEGGAGAAIPVATLKLDMGADQLSLLRGQSTRFFATVSGPDLIAANDWKAGDPTDMTYLDEVKRLSPGFKVPRPGDRGVVFVAIENASRQTISISPAKNEAAVYTLGQSDFAKGPFTHNGVAKSKQSGSFNINGLVVAFLERIAGGPLPQGHSPRVKLAEPDAPKPAPRLFFTYTYAPR